MRGFKDQQGRTWSISVNLRSVKNVREQCDILLTALFDDGAKLLQELSHDYVKIAEVLWILCEGQAADKKWSKTVDGKSQEKVGVTPDEFGESLGGDSLGEAVEALVRATADFFTSPEQRRVLNKTIDMMMSTGVHAVMMVETMVDEQNPESLAQNFMDSATNGQESPASTQTTEPLANSG